MDFQSIVDSCGMAAAVLSVENTEDNHCGEIRIVRANAMYKQIMGEKYRDDMIYSDLIPKEPNFEEFCYRCAVLKQHLHAYVDVKALNVWTDSDYIPLSCDRNDERLHYLMFFFEFTKGPESEKMSNVSLEVAQQVIKTCINLRGADNFYEAMNTVITDIQKNTQSFCSCIIMIDREKRKYAPLCSKFRNDEAKIDDFMPELTPDVVFSWEKTLENRDLIIIKDDFDMQKLAEQNPIWVKSLRNSKVENLVLVPLSQGRKMFGVLFITNFNTEKLIEIKDFIELTAFFLSAEIANNDLMEKLEYMSNIDFLTGVKNRNSMNARVDYHVDGRNVVRAPFGIIFADLNGLKQCNDNGGHEAGDRLLKNAAALLKAQFANDEIYRSGGDEFIVIMQDCDREKFDSAVKKLKDSCGYGADVCLAIGADWSQGEKDLRLCMHIADEAMYADKNQFYALHPDKARK